MRRGAQSFLWRALLVYVGGKIFHYSPISPVLVAPLVRRTIPAGGSDG
jgi:hypothetical protein